MKKCNYCDFLSFGRVSEEMINIYFQSLLREINYFSAVYGNKYYIDTIFIGGGTPSIVEERLINTLMDSVRIGFEVDSNAEISIETNPKTLIERKLKEYLNSGINRLSMGVQSCEDRLLRYLGRSHTTEDFLKNYFSARECGFQNINIDLMFGIPGQTSGMWIDTLNKVTGLSPEHISFYSLQLEEGTKFYSMLQEGSLIKPDDKLDRGMYHSALNLLKESGYIHYEISNAAKSGYQCRHNLK
ncbi:MAG: radical SAM family heme chaperone HemW, partial [Eubacteriales bacterium]|nr:radical SAM family heme chaperone HemW [Eubacteriales bacterium]